MDGNKACFLKPGQIKAITCYWFCVDYCEVGLDNSSRYQTALRELLPYVRWGIRDTGGYLFNAVFGLVCIGS
jgi:hypothetical protein